MATASAEKCAHFERKSKGCTYNNGCGSFFLSSVPLPLPCLAQQSSIRKSLQETTAAAASPTSASSSSSPVSVFREKSVQWGVAVESAEFARRMDQEDPLASFRQQFCFPKKAVLPNSKYSKLEFCSCILNTDAVTVVPSVDPSQLKSSDEDCIYLCGQSLGLKPKSLDENVQKVLDSWSQRGVHSHFHGYMPAALSDLPAKKPMAKLVGTKENNVAILNGLTVNLHLLLATFFRPTEKRFKILIEEHAFPSDTVSGPVGVRKNRKELSLCCWQQSNHHHQQHAWCWW